jgi:hypothetical protein
MLVHLGKRLQRQAPDAIDLAMAERHGLHAMPAAWFGWTAGARLEAIDADEGPRMVVLLG